jgi:NDP-sugar pyrophosphorylase family protein
MNVMILAAGLGTRLLPLTERRPKALVDFRGKPLLLRVIERILPLQPRRLVINIHHHAEQIREYLLAHDNFGLDVRLSEERPLLLDTGGALLPARDLLIPSLPLLLHNVDIISDVNLPDLLRSHAARRPRATLVVRPPAAGRLLRFSPDGQLSGWENTATGEQRIVNDRFHHSSPYAFCGIQVLSPDFLRHIHHRGVFSIIDEYLYQARHHPIHHYLHDGQFLDAGTLSQFPSPRDA